MIDETVFSLTVVMFAGLAFVIGYMMGKIDK